MRLRNIKNAKEKLTEFSDLVVPIAYFKENFKTIFNNDNPIYLEIGMGKGQFILKNALKYENINFVGLELQDSVILRAARKLAPYKLNNLKLLNLDATKLREIFPDASISKIFLNFSDPWPKSRHEKRRLTSDEFLKLYKSLLVKDGIIEMKTDNRKLFEYSLIKFNEHNYKFLELNLNLHEVENPEIITTEFEDKFKLLNQTIYYAKVKI